MQRKLMDIISVDFDTTGHLLFIYSLHLSNNGRKLKQKCISSLWTSNRSMNQ